jgi:hypothetical protein
MKIKFKPNSDMTLLEVITCVFIILGVIVNVSNILNNILTESTNIIELKDISNSYSQSSING